MTLRALLIILLCMSASAAANTESSIARSSASMADPVPTLTPSREPPSETIAFEPTGTRARTTGSFRLRYRAAST